MGKKIDVILYPGATGLAKIFWVDPWELAPQMNFFACPCMVYTYNISLVGKQKGENGLYHQVIT